MTFMTTEQKTGYVWFHVQDAPVREILPGIRSRVLCDED